MAIYTVRIESVDAVIPLPGSYTVILHFKNPNGTYANDARLPHGYRQDVFIKEFPVSIDFQFPEDNFCISDIITQITIEGNGVYETGEIRGELNVIIEDVISVINIEKECK